MIDIQKVLQEHNISYVTHGPNTKKGNINIKCPICGPDDPSEHMGIQLSNGFWGCWKSSQHRGKNLARLFHLLDIPYVDDKSEILQQLLDRTFFDESHYVEPKDTRKYTEFPKYFVSITGKSILDKPYIKYLEKRGFGDYIKEVTQDYKLCRSIGNSRWAGRLIIPVHINDEISWTGRSIGDSELRYLSPAIGEAKPIKETLFNYDELINSTGAGLIINEGALDSIAADVYNKKNGIRATCLFGLSMVDAQISLLHKLCVNYNNILIALDQDTLVQSLYLMQQLEKFNPIIMQLPKKDYNEMTLDDNNVVLKKYLE